MLIFKTSREKMLRQTKDILNRIEKTKAKNQECEIYF